MPPLTVDPADFDAFRDDLRDMPEQDCSNDIECAVRTILGRRRPIAIMCAEGVWWRCHRSMIADYLVVAGAEVVHLQPRRLDHATVLAERLPRYHPDVIAAWRHHLG